MSSLSSSSSEKKNEDISSGGYCSLLRKKDVLVTVLLYGLEAICQVSYDSLISLWLSSNPEEGGMGWTAMDIGWFLCFVCPMQSGNCRNANSKISVANEWIERKKETITFGLILID